MSLFLRRFAVSGALRIRPCASASQANILAWDSSLGQGRLFSSRALSLSSSTPAPAASSPSTPTNTIPENTSFFYSTSHDRDKPFRLSRDFVQSYKTQPVPFGFNGLGELVYLRTYSRLKEDGSNEQC